MENLGLQLSQSVALFRTIKINNQDLKYARKSDFSVLMIIYHAKGEISAIDISRILGFSKVYASKVLNHLLDRKLITREANPADRRQLFLHLTKEGRELTERVISQYIATTNCLLEKFGEEKTRTFIEILKEATAILKEYELKGK